MVSSPRGRCNDDAHCFTAWTKIFTHVFILCAIYIFRRAALKYKRNNLYCRHLVVFTQIQSAFITKKLKSYCTRLYDMGFIISKGTVVLYLKV